MDSFEAFKQKEKFTQDPSIFYPGVANSTILPILTEKINQAADDFKQASLLPAPTDQNYLDAIKTGLQRFDEIYLDIDTEDRERVCHYFEELMDIVGLASSNGQLDHFL